jgi:thymidylate synthase (FAD)
METYSQWQYDRTKCVGLTKEVLRSEYIDKKKSLEQIAQESNCSLSSVHKRLKRFGIPRRKGTSPEYYTEERKEKLRKWYKSFHPVGMRGKKHSEETKKKMSLARQGEHNSNWRGGLTQATRGKRRSPAYYQWRKAILVRDKFTCRRCGRIRKTKMHAHHIYPVKLYPEKIYSVKDGITLCRECHEHLHRKRR